MCEEIEDQDTKHDTFNLNRKFDDEQIQIWQEVICGCVEGSPILDIEVKHAKNKMSNM